MICPHCGDKIHEPGIDRFCPSCGKELPHQTPDEKAIIRDRKIAMALLTPSFILIILGASFVAPDLMLRAIVPEIGPMFWPYSMIMLVIGVVLMVVRHPFAKRSRGYSAILVKQVQQMWTCSFCGTENAPGSLKCASCGAPLNKS